MQLRFRQLWLKLHLLLGLSAGLLFCFAGLTGSLLVFDHALDESLNASRMLTAEQGNRRSLVELIAAASKSQASSQVPASIAYPRTSNGVFTVLFKQKDRKGAIPKEVFVAPVTAEYLGERERDSGIMHSIYKLHSSLLAGETGKTITGGLACLVLASLISGVVLWWTLLKAGLRAAFSIRRRMLTFDLHKTAGILFAPVLLLIAFTGTHLALPQYIKPVVTRFFTETKLPQKVKSKPASPGQDPITPDDAARIAQETMPACRLMSVELPAEADDAFRVFVRQVGEVGDLRGVGRVWVDQYSGNVLATRDWNRFTLADTYFRVQLALHSGDAFGLLGRWLFCLAGLVPTLLFITGTALRWRKRTARMRKRRYASLTSPAEAGIPVHASSFDRSPVG